jgi:cation-transporting ATPase E
VDALRPEGLTSAQVADRIAAGLVNRVPSAPSRTVGQILRANLFTPVNAIVGTLLVLILVAEGGPSPDMLFAGVIVANSAIGTVQELRARAALHRLALLQVPTAVALRDGEEQELQLHDVVADDVLRLQSGTQVVVDGEVVSGDGLELDESLLTGEADPVGRAAGEEVLSGSFVVAGNGWYRATRVGGDAYAASLAEEAKRFSLVSSELRSGVNRLLRVLMVLIPPVAALLLWRLLATGDGWRSALAGVVAACVAMVPDGLVLLTSLAFMAGVITLSRRDALLRELASVELLARVDTLCLDKTGTITSGRIRWVGLQVLDAEPSSREAFAREALAALAAADPEPNPTLAAIAEAVGPEPGWTATATVPFSSARKWSAASFTADGEPLAVFLGAPEYLAGDDAAVAEAVVPHARAGDRVVLVATSDELEGERIPSTLQPLALVVLQDELRSDAAETLAYLVAQGIRLKVISGDHPDTVAAIARRAGVPGADHGVDARNLPTEPEPLGQHLETDTVFGRVAPHQKQEMVRSLQGRGHVVAMTGDGVNDVLALKDADMGIAMGSGSAATRAVAQLVLLDDRYSVLPLALAEGRRVINSVERAANLFVYGTVYAVLTSVVVSIAGTSFPYLPRHLTLVRSLSVGIPGLFLALAPDPRRARPGFLARVVRFAVPAGVIAAAASLVVFLIGTLDDGVSTVEARSSATIALLGVGLAILVRLTGSLPAWRWALVACMASTILVVLAVPPLARFFELDHPPPELWVVMAVSVAVAAASLWLVPVTADTPGELDGPDALPETSGNRG